MRATILLFPLILGVLAPASASLRVDVAGPALEDALPAIGKPEQFPLECGPHAAGRRFFIFASNRNAHELAEELKHVVPVAPGKALLYRDGSRYTFDEDLASVQAREAAVRRRLREGEAKRRKLLAEMRRFVQPRPGETEPEARGRARFRDYLSVFDGLPKSALDAALSGKPVNVPYADLGESTQRTLRRMVAGVPVFKAGEEALSRDYTRTIVQLFPIGSPDRPGIRMWLRISPSGGREMTDLLNPPKWTPSEGWEWEPNTRSERWHGPKDGDKIPGLQSRISVEGRRGAYVENTLRELVQKSGFALVGEYDPCYSIPGQPELRGMRTALEKGKVTDVPVWKALEMICTRFDLDWTYHDGWIHIRSPRTLLSWSGELDLSPPPAKPSQ